MTNIDTELVEAYSKISQRYSALKKKPWKDFQSYLSDVKKRLSLPSSGKILDIGTGNGRNLLLFEEEEWEYFASDLSIDLLRNFIQISRSNTNRLNNDMKMLPFREKAVDFVLCIATLHHSRSNMEATLILSNIRAIMKEEGYLILSCWRRWKRNSMLVMLKDLLLYPMKKMQNRTWRHGDIHLPWFNDEKEIIAERYYHLYTTRELLRLVKNSQFKVLDMRKMGGKGSKDNIFLLLKKN